MEQSFKENSAKKIFTENELKLVGQEKKKSSIENLHCVDADIEAILVKKLDERIEDLFDGYEKQNEINRTSYKVSMVAKCGLVNGYPISYCNKTHLMVSIYRENW